MDIEQLKKAVWAKGVTDPAYQEDHVRKDACGAWIVFEHFGDRNSPFGWEIDHVIPAAKLCALGIPKEKIDYLLNLRPLNWRNNASKGANYPSYIASVKADNDRNIMKETPMDVNAELQVKLKAFYNL